MAGAYGFWMLFPCCYGMVHTPTDAASGLPHSENAILVPSGLLHPDRITRVMDRRCFPGVIKTIRWYYRIQSPSVGERAVLYADTSIVAFQMTTT